MTANLPKTISTIHALAMDEAELMRVLESSVYPGAKPESIRLVVNACRAAQRDPLKKPFHIVPMSVKDSRSGKYEWRDVIMPGIANYRMDASRTGQYAGASEPEFGPDVKLNLDGTEITVPEWCKVTVYRQMATGQIVAFTAREYWVENYATAGRDTKRPNSMWMRRPRGQLSKCAEAQALRKGFPDATGDAPTADEMAGNPVASVEVKVAPDGTIVGRRLTRSSGVPAWDEAVLRAIDKTEVLPRDVDGRVPPSMLIDFRPRD